MKSTQASTESISNYSYSFNPFRIVIKDKILECKTDGMVRPSNPNERLLDIDPEFYA